MKPSSIPFDHALRSQGEVLEIQAQLDDCTNIHTQPVGKTIWPQIEPLADTLIAEDERSPVPSLQRQGAGSLGDTVCEPSASYLDRF